MYHLLQKAPCFINFIAPIEAKNDNLILLEIHTPTNPLLRKKNHWIHSLKVHYENLKWGTLEKTGLMKKW